MFVNVNQFHPSLIFVSAAKPLSDTGLHSETRFLASMDQTRVEVFGDDKHTSLVIKRIRV